MMATRWLGAVHAFVIVHRIVHWVFAVFVALAAPPALAVDLHAMWDNRCAGCHGHSADFARRFLTVEGGKLRGRHHRDDLDRFLPNHYLAPDLVAPVIAMLAAQASATPRFRERCGGCHQTAAELARDKLSLRDGELVDRESGRRMRDFLPGHGRLPAAEAPFFVDLLTRLVRETGAR